MNLYEKLRGKIPYIYYVGDMLIAVCKENYSIINNTYDYSRISDFQKIIKENNDKEVIKSAVTKISMIAEFNAQNSNSKLSEFIQNLKEEEVKELQMQIKELEKLYRKYKLAY
ncbi:hypothetical protein SAMN02745883_00705 [Caminicella sporogenes DSM 14501]|uniref:Uncharacterized protein n=1 Tax=Caminicella sporogenes DSM 14501 TaxID=1121266 RepID=A0A1M6MYJ9_9FIRM|nr:hypothetical protein [Caminicella sporogenes]RKD22443.1 hypothetical protein BET04_05265 [Caminicella sporogenes]SHJ88516.1 hypothetical protein SAMN02745883_00705 [Caminicella sporogenes DSM 14501]